MARRPLTLAALLATAALVQVALGAETPQRQIEDVRRVLAEIKTHPATKQRAVEELTSQMVERFAHVREAAPEAATAAFPPVRNMPAGAIGVIPVSLALSFLNGGHGAVASRPSGMDVASSVLVVRSGRLTLKQLVAVAAAQVPQAMVQDAQGATALLPILIWSDAELVLEAGDRLALSAEKGSFIINAGLLRIDAAAISATPAAANAEDRPFVATVLGGAFQARNSVFTGLGYGGVPGREGVVLAPSALSPQKAKSAIIANSFEDVASLVVRHAADVEIRGNRFADTRLSALHLDASSNIRVSGNTILNGHGSAAIMVNGRSSAIVVSDNTLISGTGQGIRLGEEASDVRLSRNLIAKHGKDAVVVERSACVNVSSNLLFDNANNGITVGRSSNVVMSDNLLLRNRGSGVFIRAQAKEALTVMTGNTFVANGTGIRGQGASAIEVEHNNLEAQLPIMLSGDLSAYVRELSDKNGAGERLKLSPVSWVAEQPSAAPLKPVAVVSTCQNGS